MFSQLSSELPRGRRTDSPKRPNVRSLSRWIFLARADTVVLEPRPVPPRSILAGAPASGYKVLHKTHDMTSVLVVWECSAGRFTWYYPEDETLVIVSGEAFITDTVGNEQRLVPGTTVCFPAGSSTIWRIPRCVRKIAIVRKDMPRVVGFGVRAWHKWLRLAQLRRASSFSDC